MYLSMLLCFYRNIFNIHKQMLSDYTVDMIHHRISDGDIRSLDTGLLLKTKGRKEVYSSEPEPKFPTGANLDVFCVQ